MLYLHEDIDENGESRITCPPNLMLLAAATGPISRLEKLVCELNADLSIRDPLEGFSPLHLAADVGDEENVQWMLDHGARWNLADAYERTAGELALRNGFPACYRIIFENAVSSEYEYWCDPHPSRAGGDNLLGNLRTQPYRIFNNNYLDADVKYMNPRPEVPGDFAMVMQGGAGVMMEWERPLMKETARLLCEDMGKGKSVLNVGFGLGIIDSYLQSYEPMTHTIIEAHPQCLEYMREHGWYDKPNVRILEGPWNDFIGPQARNDIEWPARNDGTAIDGLGTFDAIYFDTFNEGYPGHLAFLRCVPHLLSGPRARFSFFHGHSRGWEMGYEVYSEVARLHANDFGLASKYYDCHINPKTVWESFHELDGDHHHPYKIPILYMGPTVMRRNRLSI